MRRTRTMDRGNTRESVECHNFLLVGSHEGRVIHYTYRWELSTITLNLSLKRPDIALVQSCLLITINLIQVTREFFSKTPVQRYRSTLYQIHMDFFVLVLVW